MSTDRVTRPTLERSAPVRSLFGSPARPSVTPGGDVGRGVQLGYTVIEDYLRQGQELAKGMWTPGAQAGPPDPQQLANRLVQYASDFAAAWMEYLQSALSLSGAAAGGPAPPAGTAGPFDIGGAAAAAPAAVSPPEAPAANGQPALTLDVRSSQPITVTVDLKPGSASAPLLVHDLRSADGAQPRILDVAVVHDPDGDRLVARVRVPDQQPRGTYSGLIVDRRSNLPRGSMTVRIED